MNEYYPAYAATALAAVMAEGRSDEEVEFLSALFVQIGDSLATISATRSLGKNER